MKSNHYFIDIHIIPMMAKYYYRIKNEIRHNTRYIKYIGR